MSDISVSFLHNFRSFKQGDTVKFRGNLNAVTGENGSGKSQILMCMSGGSALPSHQNINITSVCIDDELISPDEILYSSFKSVSQPNLSSKTTHAALESNKNSLFNVYLGQNLNSDNRLLYNRIHEAFRQKLGDTYHQIIHNDQYNFVKYLPSNFFNDTKNIFITDLSSRFHQYAREIRRFKANQYDLGYTLPDNITINDLCENELGKAPWTFFNELFEKINFEYRFADNYDLNEIDIIDDISLKHVNNSQISVQIFELSDGEIALFSLFTAFLRTKHDAYKIKLLLLDEYDAPFNPLLIQQYLIMLEQYFVAEGIRVILSSHSPNTIALLPTGTSIYWFKKPSQAQICSRYEEITKAQALGKLAEGIPYFKVDIDNKKIAFCEEENDSLYYEKAFKALKGNKIFNTDGTITFVGVHKVHKAEINSQNGGCLKVKENTELLRGQGIGKIAGILDWDLHRQDEPDNAIFIHGLENRYSLENYLFEPIFICKVLIDENIIKAEDISSDFTLGQFNYIVEPNEQYQQFCNQYFQFLNSKLVQEDKFELTQQKQVTYCNEYTIFLPIKYLEMRGHDLEKLIINALISDKNKLNRFHHKSIVRHILIEVIEALPYFISKDTLTVFKQILNHNS